MTPTERARRGLWRAEEGSRPYPDDLADERADAVLDALCPKGQRVVLDRTGDTDRLVKQRIQGVDWETITYAWVDVDSDGAS